MKQILNGILIVAALAFAGGCATLFEPAKTIWGSSTRALEKARADAISRTYQCGLNDCFDAVLTMERKPVETKPYQTGSPSDEPGELAEPVPAADTGFFDAFIKDRRKRHIVVIGIQGNVDTTEVGIFFEQTSPTTVKLDVTSLSSSAKRKVAQAVFEALDLRFSAVE